MAIPDALRIRVLAELHLVAEPPGPTAANLAALVGAPVGEVYAALQAMAEAKVVAGTRAGESTPMRWMLAARSHT